MAKTFDASVQTITLNDGSQIPQAGFGTFKIDPTDTQRAVEEALEIGYRHIDTASAYANEAGVGAALRATGMVGSVYTVTKLRNADQGYDNALRACETSLKDLGLDRIDLYLIHWPVPTQDRYVETWRAMRKLVEEGLVGSIGVCNFLPDHLRRLVDETGVVPAVNQVESHPAFWRPELDALCRELGVVVEAYSPLGRGSDIESEPARRGRRAWRDLRAGGAALAHPEGPRHHPEVDARRAHAREPRRVRLRAHRYRDGGFRCARLPGGPD